MVYVPSDTTYNACVVVQSSDTIRVYEEQPTTNRTIRYRDYYINSSYIYKDNTQTFSQYTTLPSCLASTEISHDVFYRNDIDKILVTFIILLIICFYFPYKIITRMMGRWFRL